MGPGEKEQADDVEGRRGKNLLVERRVAIKEQQESRELKTVKKEAEVPSQVRGGGHCG